MFFNKDSDNTVPVCSQINCNHLNDSCDSYFEHMASLGVWYYDQQVYVMLYDANDYTYYLSSVSLDGSKRERVCDLLKLEVSKDEMEDVAEYRRNIDELVIHRGYAYYTIPNNDSSPELRRIQLKKNAKPEVIYTDEGVNSYISSIKGFENHVYFQSYTTRMSDSEEPEVLTANMYDYDILSGDLSIRLKDSLFDYIPMSDKIYYLDNEGINCYLFENSQIETIYKATPPYAISYDGECFYIDNQFKSFMDGESRCISVFNKDFKLIDKIQLDHTYSICFFGDEDYMFCYNTSDYGRWMEALDKSQIGTGTHEWIRLE